MFMNFHATTFLCHTSWSCWYLISELTVNEWLVTRMHLHELYTGLIFGWILVTSGWPPSLAICFQVIHLCPLSLHSCNLPKRSCTAIIQTIKLQEQIPFFIYWKAQKQFRHMRSTTQKQCMCVYVLANVCVRCYTTTTIINKLTMRLHNAKVLP